MQASVFQVTRAPGRNIVYLGCALLILGVFAMLYVRERRLWVWLSAAGERRRRRTMALSSNRKTDGQSTANSSSSSDRLLARQAMNTATTHHHPHAQRRLLRAPQLRSTGCSPLLVPAGGAVCLRALRAVHGRLREGHPARRHAGRHLAGLVLAAAARADAGGGRRSRCWPSRPTRASLARADTVFWLKYFLSSQSAILWMSVLFFMSTVVLLARHVRRAARRDAMERIGSRLAWVGGRHGADRHHGALVRELPDRPRHRPHPGQQPVRSVRAVLLDDRPPSTCTSRSTTTRARWAPS